MKVTKKETQPLTYLVTMEIEKNEANEKKAKQLKEYRKKAEIKGFRKGMVPESLVRRVYGDQALAESVNEVISKGLQDFIEENKLNVLGEPLGSEKQPEIDWVSGNDFDFVFDIALTPEINVDVVKEDTVFNYTITVSAKEKENMVSSLKKFYEERKEEKTDEEIEKEVAERFEASNKDEAAWRLNKDIRTFYVEKAGIELPEAFLKRWLLHANEGKVTEEQLEQEFPAFVEDFKWQLVRGYLMKKFGFEISQQDIEEAAKSYVAYQYAMYGLGNVPENMIADAVKNILNDRKQIDRLAEQVEDQKVISKIKETITLKAKKISSEKFRELK